MNIFAVHDDPVLSATELPDKHVVKMPLECCQMLAVVFSKWYLNCGVIVKRDGTEYATEKGAFRNHPCTKWVAESPHNTQWLIAHGLALCEEYTYRYDKMHGCHPSLTLAGLNYQYGCPDKHTPFARAMPEEWKFDDSISTHEAYQRYIASKPWVPTNYLRQPHNKPSWVDCYAPLPTL
jgi:hypothetical protein